MTIHGFNEFQGLKWTLNITCSNLLPLRDQMLTTKIPGMWSNGLCPNTSNTEHITSYGSPLIVSEAKKVLP